MVTFRFAVVQVVDARVVDAVMYLFVEVDVAVQLLLIAGQLAAVAEIIHLDLVTVQLHFVTETVNVGRVD